MFQAEHRMPACCRETKSFSSQQVVIVDMSEVSSPACLHLRSAMSFLDVAHSADLCFSLLYCMPLRATQ